MEGAAMPRFLFLAGWPLQPRNVTVYNDWQVPEHA
jgi:hypothetical protein